MWLTGWDMRGIMNIGWQGGDAMKTLKTLKPGVDARVVCVHGGGALRRRIMEMGLTPGAAVLVRKIAPLGDPIEILVRGYALSLRKADAALVEIAARPHWG